MRQSPPAGIRDASRRESQSRRFDDAWESNDDRFEPVLSENSDPNRLIEAFRRGEYLAILSSVTAAEVEQAPDQVKALHTELIDGGAELLPVSTESMDLLYKS